MVGTYLKTVAKQLRNFSASLEKTSIIVDKPWAVIDEEFEMQKLIFRKNKELILSKNGKVKEGKWDYFPEARSLLIDRNTDKILCNVMFVDEGAMILKLDGTDNKFFALANENEVPDLDVYKYFKQLKYSKLNIQELDLDDGNKLEVHVMYTGRGPQIGDEVTLLGAETRKDGRLSVTDKRGLITYFELKGERISNISFEKTYTTLDGQQLLVKQRERGLSKGDQVFINAMEASKGTIHIDKNSKLIIRDGRVHKLKKKESYEYNGIMMLVVVLIILAFILIILMPR